MRRDITDAFCVIDHENRVVWVNNVFQNLFSHHGSLQGKSIKLLLPGIPDNCMTGQVFSDISADKKKRYYDIECTPTRDENGNIVSYLITFRDVSLLQTLLNISDLTVKSTTGKELLNKALDIITDTFGYKTIAALLHQNGYLELAASRGYSPALQSLLARQKVSAEEKGLSGRSAYLNQIIIKDIKEGTVSNRLLEESRRLGISSVITIPLVDRKKLVGVLAVSTEKRLSMEEVNLLKILCNQLSVSLRKILFEEELVGARDELELYIDLMCHDITNANQIALGYLELAHDKNIEQAGKYIDCAVASINRTMSLIDCVRKIRLAHLKSTEKINLKKTMDDTLVDIYCVTDVLRKSVRISSNISPDIYVKANPMLRDLFYNIFDFIIRRIDNNGAINISAVTSDQTCNITFEDTGPGIEDLDRFFFIRNILKSSRTGQIGISVYLIHSIVESYGGHIYLEYRVEGQPDKGNRLILTLNKW